MLVCGCTVPVLWYSRITFDGKIFTLTVATISMRFRLLKSLKSLGIPSDSMWNSKWNYLGRYGGPHITEHLNFSRNHKDTKQLPWEYFFASYHKKYVHLEFHMESLGIPSEMQINSIEWHIRRVSAPQSIRTRTESLKIRNKYSGSTFLQRYLHLEFHLESHRITWNSKWNEMVSDGTHGRSPHHRSLEVVRKA